MADGDSVTEKTAAYAAVRGEIMAVLAGEPNVTARMATVSCLLAQAFPDRYYWTGFYVVDPERPRELVVGPYQGTMGCLRIPFGRGVCGTAAETGSTQIVEDVLAIENHIACDHRSRSEIVVPVRDAGGRLIAVFDVDSARTGSFDAEDARQLEALLGDVFGGKGV